MSGSVGKETKSPSRSPARKRQLKSFQTRRWGKGTTEDGATTENPCEEFKAFETLRWGTTTTEDQATTEGADDEFKSFRTRTWGNMSLDIGRSSEDFHAEAAQLQQQLAETQRLVLHAAQAPAVAPSVNVEGLRMQNSELVSTVNKLREENAVLLQRQQKMQQEAIEGLQARQELEQIVRREDAELRRMREETGNLVKILRDDIMNLNVQLSKQRQQCIDAEEQRDAQKQLFLKMFMKAKHDMEQSHTQHAKAVKHALSEGDQHVGEQVTASPLENGNAVARIRSEGNLMGNLTDLQRTQAAKRVWAKHYLELAAARRKAAKVSLPHLSPTSPML